MDEGQLSEQVVRYPPSFACEVLVSKTQPGDLSLFRSFWHATRLGEQVVRHPQSFACEVLAITETHPFDLSLFRYSEPLGLEN